MASVFCAFGQLVADVRHDHMRSFIVQWEQVTVEQINNALDQLEEIGRSGLRREGVVDSQIYFTRSIDLRYVGQIHEVSIELPWSRAKSKQDLSKLAELLHLRHEALYTYSEPESLIEAVNIGVSACGRVPKVDVAGATNGQADAGAAIYSKREIYLSSEDTSEIVNVYDGARLCAGNVIKGPAIVEEATTTIVVFPQWKLTLDGRDFYTMSYVN